MSNLRFRSRAETCCHQNCENSLIFSLLAGYLMRRPVRIGLPPPPRTLLAAGLSHALPNCASVHGFSAAVSEVLRLRLRAGARFPRLSTARLRLLETVSRRIMQRPIRERGTGSETFSACAWGEDQNAPDRRGSSLRGPVLLATLYRPLLRSWPSCEWCLACAGRVTTPARLIQGVGVLQN